MSDTITNISAFIEENFGANATYVEGLLARYQANPNSVDESWQEYFSQLLNGSQGTPAETRPSGSVSTTQPPAKPEKPSPTLAPYTTSKPITGPAKTEMPAKPK